MRGLTAAEGEASRFDRITLHRDRRPGDECGSNHPKLWKSLIGIEEVEQVAAFAGIRRDPFFGGGRGRRLSRSCGGCRDGCCGGCRGNAAGRFYQISLKAGEGVLPPQLSVDLLVFDERLLLGVEDLMDFLLGGGVVLAVRLPPMSMTGS